MSSRALAIGVLVFMIIFPLGNFPVLAHHGTTSFSPNEVTLKGTIVKYEWINPHVLVQWTVVDSGNDVQWTGELASIPSMLADGMTKNSLKPGDEVLMTIRPVKSGAPNSVIDQIKLADGTMVLRWGRQGSGTPEEQAAREAARKAQENANTPNTNK